MNPRSDFPINTDVEGDSFEGLTDEEAKPWRPTPSEDDEDNSITVTVVVSEEDVLVEAIKLTKETTEGVEQVIVVVKDKNGEPVVCTAIDIATLFDPLLDKSNIIA